MTDPLEVAEVVLPPHVLVVKLYRGQRREIDLRMVSRVVRDQEVEASGWPGHPEVSLHFIGGANPLVIHHSEFDRVMRALRVQQERRAAPGPMTVSNQNLDEIKEPVIEFGGYEVYSWCPARDGKGRSEQVHLMINVTLADVPVKLVHRFKTKGAINQMVDVLTQYREEVWPTT